MPLIDTALSQHLDDIENGEENPLKRHKRVKLGLLPLVALVFYEVSGGPFGTEVSTSPCAAEVAMNCQNQNQNDVKTPCFPMTCCKTKGR